MADNAATRALAQGQTATEIYTVTVSDGLGGVDTIRIPVTITGVNDAPTDIALGSTTLPANNGTGTIVGSVTVTDVDSTAFTFDTHNPNFAVTGTPGNYQLVVTNHVDMLPPAITITAIDDGGLSYSESFALTLPIQLFDSTGHLLSSYSTIQGAVNGATDAAIAAGDERASSLQLPRSLIERRFVVGPRLQLRFDPRLLLVLLWKWWLRFLCGLGGLGALRALDHDRPPIVVGRDAGGPGAASRPAHLRGYHGRGPATRVEGSDRLASAGSCAARRRRPRRER